MKIIFSHSGHVVLIIVDRKRVRAHVNGVGLSRTVPLTKRASCKGDTQKSGAET